VPFKELYAGYQQLAADAERKSLVDDEPMHEGMRRRSPIERRAFEKLASRMFEPSPARDQVLATLYELLDLDYDGTVDAGEMLVALVALCSGSIDEKLSVCFQVFDADHSGRLDQAELADLVHTTLLRGLHVVEALFRNYLPEGSRESTELVTLFSLANFSAIEQVAQRALSEADADGDGRVDEAEFRAWAAKHPLLRQLLTLSQVLFGS
jgi:Ca2+-binding EF-hand superfamily protein